MNFSQNRYWIMKNSIIIVFVIFIACNGSNNNTQAQHQYDYPGLGLIIDAYYRDYYDYPNSIEDLVTFTDESGFPENFDKTIEKLKKSKSEIELLKEEKKLKISINDSLIYTTPMSTPCDQFSDNKGFYLGRVLFFDEKGKAINSEEISNQFKIGLKNIKYHYNMVEKEGNANKYVMLKFEDPDGLSLFCDDCIPLNDYEYFKEVEIFTNKFSEEHKIREIIFVTPIFYN